MRKLFILLLVALAVTSFARAQDPKKDKCTTSYSGEAALYNKNYWVELGQTFDRDPSFQFWIEVERRCGKVGFGGWGAASLSVKHNPGPGTEGDAAAFVAFYGKKITARTDAEMYVFEKGDKLYALRETLSGEFKISDKLDGEIVNTTLAYFPNSREVRRGIVNKTAFTVSGDKGRFHGSATVAVGFDNNPIDFGQTKFVTMGSFNLRGEWTTSKHTALFVSVDGSRPLAGQTIRTSQTMIGGGLKFWF